MVLAHRNNGGARGTVMTGRNAGNGARIADMGSVAAGEDAGAEAEMGKGVRIAARVGDTEEGGEASSADEATMGVADTTAVLAEITGVDRDEDAEITMVATDLETDMDVVVRNTEAETLMFRTARIVRAEEDITTPRTLMLSPSLGVMKTTTTPNHGKTSRPSSSLRNPNGKYLHPMERPPRIRNREVV